MIIKHTYSDKGNVVIPKELDDIILNTRPEWTRAKEDIWKEMEAKIDASPVEKKIQPIRHFRVLKYAVAASVALLISFGAAASLYTKNVLTAAVEKSFLLPDNSKVILHANSSLSYKPLMWMFSRTTTLDGEAYFEVEKGSKFEVVSEKAKTVVLGTRFLVTARKNEYRVNCDQGKVMIIESVQKNEVVIAAGQKATLKTDKKFEVIQQHQNKSNGINSETIVSAKGNEITISEDEPKFVPKDEMKSEPSSQKINGQERIRLQKPTQPDVKPNVTSGIKENYFKANEKASDALASKPQNENQVRATLQKPEEEASTNSSESSKSRFRNSLTQKQIDILEDKKMDRAEKQKAFMKSLSSEQRQLLKEQNGNMGIGNGGQKNINANNGNPKNAMKDNMKTEQKGHKSQLPNTPVDKGNNGQQRGRGNQSPK